MCSQCVELGHTIFVLRVHLRRWVHPLGLPDQRRVYVRTFRSAELLLEITQGSDNPINLSIYEISSQGNEDTLIKNIIQNDLIRTGEIKFIEGVDIVPLPENGLEFNYSGWKLLGLDYVVIPKNAVAELKYPGVDIKGKIR